MKVYLFVEYYFQLHVAHEHLRPCTARVHLISMCASHVCMCVFVWDVVYGCFTVLFLCEYYELLPIILTLLSADYRYWLESENVHTFL